MKTKNKDNRSSRRAIALLAAIVVIVAAAVAAVLAYNKLHALWIEQCAVTDVNRQVEIQSGSSIAADTVREMFGLRNGANLALIDFAEKRSMALKKYPVIKSIAVSRRLPDGVAITVIERDPIARIGVSGSKKDTGRVCDDEGVVFNRRRGAEMLPVIREPASSSTATGARLEDRSRQALAVLLIAREAEFADLNILEIDTVKPDYLLITLTNYSSVKFRWNGMDSITPESGAALRIKLVNLTKAMSANLSGEAKVWDATTDRISSSTTRPN